jgi:hypothetical protein
LGSRKIDPKRPRVSVVADAPASPWEAGLTPEAQPLSMNRPQRLFRLPRRSGSHVRAIAAKCLTVDASIGLRGVILTAAGSLGFISVCSNPGLSPVRETGGCAFEFNSAEF